MSSMQLRSLLPADSCLAQETLQRSKGDAKQSTLQKFAPKASGSKTTGKRSVPAQLVRSATTTAASKPAQQPRKARRTSSDSALLLPVDKQQQQQPQTDAPAGNESDDDCDAVLPIRPVRQKSDAHLSPAGTPAATQPVRATSTAVSGITPPNQQQSPSAADSCTSVQTSIVGRRFRSNITCTRHTQVSLVRQPDNPRDSNAIQVVDTARQAILGYLPREIAQHLAGLLDADTVQVTATVDEPKSVAAPVPILLEVIKPPVSPRHQCCMLQALSQHIVLLSQCYKTHVYALGSCHAADVLLQYATSSSTMMVVVDLCILCLV